MRQCKFFDRRLICMKMRTNLKVFSEKIIQFIIKQRSFKIYRNLWATRSEFSNFETFLRISHVITFLIHILHLLYMFYERLSIFLNRKLIAHF